jgi:hypothetical protein
MIQGHWNADFVLICELHEVTIEHAIIQNVKMAKSCSFGVSCSTGSKLNVSWIFEIYGALSVI